MARIPRWLVVVVATALAVLALRGAWGMWARCQQRSPEDAADAVPLYLSGLALREGGDPTDVALRERLSVRERTRTQVLSTLYPATIAPPMAMLVGQGWTPFLLRWRAIVVTAVLVGAAATGWGGARGRLAPIGAALGMLIVSTAFPLTEGALFLGQANLLIAGLLGLATWSAARDRGGGVAAAAVVGAAIKLVPAIALWPLLAARRWRALAVALGLGAALILITFTQVPPANVIGNVLDTVRFQQDVRPAWQGFFPGPLLPFLAVVRLTALGSLSLVIVGICAHSTRAEPERPDVLAGGIALLIAWLGASASAVGVYYGLLALPALIRLAVRPLAERSSRWTWLFVPIAALPHLFVTADLMDVSRRCRCSSLPSASGPPQPSSSSPRAGRGSDGSTARPSSSCSSSRSAARRPSSQPDHPSLRPAVVGW